MNTNAKIMSFFLAYAAIALAMVVKPYEYTMALSVFINFAKRDSRSKCTSEKKNINRYFHDLRFKKFYSRHSLRIVILMLRFSIRTTPVRVCLSISKSQHLETQPHQEEQSTSITPSF